MRKVLHAAVLSAGLVIAPSAEAQDVHQHDYSFERMMQRDSLKARIQRLRERGTHMRAQVLKGTPEPIDLSRAWDTLYVPLVKGIDQRYEMGGAHVGSEKLKKGLTRMGNQKRRDSFVVDDALVQPLVDMLRRLHADFPGEEPFEMCIVHTHPRSLPDWPVRPMQSLPPSGSDLKDVLDAGLQDELSEYVGRKVIYREAVVDAKGMWIFSGAGNASAELSVATAREIYDVQIGWAQFVASGTLPFSALLSSAEYASLRDTYRKFGVLLEYVSHEDAQHMPLCRRMSSAR